MKIELAAGDRLEIVFAETDGAIFVDFDSKGNSKLTVETDFPDTSGRVGTIYEENFLMPPEKTIVPPFFDSLNPAHAHIVGPAPVEEKENEDAHGDDLDGTFT